MLPVALASMQLSDDDSDLSAVVAALAEFEESELCALIESTNSGTHLVRGLLTWIGHAGDWELNRRAGVDFPLKSPLTTIPTEEDAASIAAVMTMRQRFVQGFGGDTCAAVALFDAITRVLTGGKHRH